MRNGSVAPPDTVHAGHAADPPGPAGPAGHHPPRDVVRYSLLEQATREHLLQLLGGREEAARALCTLEEQQRAARDEALTDIWRRVGRFLVAGDDDVPRGDVLWRRLYLTEVAPWADYVAGDEFRYLGLTGPITPWGQSPSGQGAGDTGGG